MKYYNAASGWCKRAFINGLSCYFTSKVFCGGTQEVRFIKTNANKKWWLCSYLPLRMMLVTSLHLFTNSPYCLCSQGYTLWISFMYHKIFNNIEQWHTMKTLHCWWALMQWTTAQQSPTSAVLSHSLTAVYAKVVLVCYCRQHR